jgi:ribosomal protein S18 acetylase RimI-like enzyme
LGEAILRHALVYFESRGLVGADLTVDTGNESGALRRYEKVGFNPESSWIQMWKPNEAKN